jgi:hypothetical protein
MHRSEDLGTSFQEETAQPIALIFFASIVLLPIECDTAFLLISNRHLSFHNTLWFGVTYF